MLGPFRGGRAGLLAPFIGSGRPAPPCSGPAPSPAPCRLLFSLVDPRASGGGSHVAPQGMPLSSGPLPGSPPQRRKLRQTGTSGGVGGSPLQALPQRPPAAFLRSQFLFLWGRGHYRTATCTGICSWARLGRAKPALESPVLPASWKVCQAGPVRGLEESEQKPPGWSLPPPTRLPPESRAVLGFPRGHCGGIHWSPGPWEVATPHGCLQHVPRPAGPGAWKQREEGQLQGPALSPISPWRGHRDAFCRNLLMNTYLQACPQAQLSCQLFLLACPVSTRLERANHALDWAGPNWQSGEEAENEWLDDSRVKGCGRQCSQIQGS
ncbi:uncharacterized protein LOC103099073 [Monodelphis domestica]|uniref:uncharacterized protein LOC103099073 n=1 Tax=Monodelphis domestica TaxID=13616 RepID=UPI0007B40AB4|nr:uncharacterized protein LOC103099073 [Monodelphis domestica]